MKLFSATAILAFSSVFLVLRLAPVAATLDCLGDDSGTTTTKLDFLHSTVTKNTLHEVGGELRYEGIGIVRDRPVSLVVTITSGNYANIANVWKNRDKGEPDEMNGKKEGSEFGNINLQTVEGKPKSGEGNFRMCFVDKETNQLTKVEEFSWTVYDLDERGTHSVKKPVIKEKFVIDTTQAKLFHLWPTKAQSQLKLSCEDGSQTPCGQGIRTVFHSSKSGSGDDNPTNSSALTNLQKKRSVSFTFVNTDCWEFTYDHYCPVEQAGYDGPSRKKFCKYYTGGNFLFAGDSETIINEGECLTPPPASTTDPTISPTTSPMFGPTSALSPSPTMSPTTAPSNGPTTSPTISPTVNPTSNPAVAPTASRSAAPTSESILSPTTSPTDVSESRTSPTFSPTSTPSYLPTASPTPSPTIADAERSTESPMFSPTIAPTVSPTVPTTVRMTESPTVSPTNQPMISPIHSCPEDINLFQQHGSTTISIENAVKIVKQNTSKVTVSLHQTWTQSFSKQTLFIDHIYYSFRESTFNQKCYEAKNVQANAIYDTIEIQCDVTQPRALLEVCVADNISHEVLVAGDDATVPKCCHPDFPPDTPVVCYNVEINCVTECVGLPEHRRALRGSTS